METNVPGHEGVGIIVKLGRGVDSSKCSLGQRVGIKWINETCRQCEICERDETACPSQHNSGRDRPGTLQQYACVAADHASPIPDGLPGHLAAPLLCGKQRECSERLCAGIDEHAIAGLTMFSAIRRSNTRKGEDR